MLRAEACAQQGHGAPLFDRDDDHLHPLDAVVRVEAEAPGQANSILDRAGFGRVTKIDGRASFGGSPSRWTLPDTVVEPTRLLVGG